MRKEKKCIEWLREIIKMFLKCGKCYLNNKMIDLKKKNSFVIYIIVNYFWIYLSDKNKIYFESCLLISVL